MEELAKYNKQGQVTRDDVHEIANILGVVKGIFTDIEFEGQISMTTAQFDMMLAELISKDVNVLPNTVKLELETMLATVLAETAKEIRRYYSRNHFDLSPEVKDIMRHAVEINIKEGLL